MTPHRRGKTANETTGNRKQRSRALRSLLALGLVAGAVVAASPLQAQEKVVRVQKYSDARNIDPHKLMTRSVSEFDALLFDTLVSIDDDLKTIKDGLAKEWSVSDDGLTYTFKLKDNLHFCDGKVLNAQSVLASFARWRAPETKSLNTGLLGSLQTVSAPDDKTVVFKLATPSDQFLINMASPYSGIIDADEAKTLGDQFGVSHMNGSGPYCWESRRPREAAIFTPNKYFTWGNGVYANKGPVKIDKLQIDFLPEENARASAMLAGESAASYYLPWTSLDDFKKNPDFALVEPRAFGYLAYIGIRVNRPLMEPAVRHAMNLAIDRKAMTEEMNAGYGKPAGSVVSPDFDGYNPKVEAIQASFNLELARKTLDDAGWKLGSDGVRYKNGVKLAPVMIGHNPWRARLEAVQGMLREVGIDVQLQITDTPIATSRIMTKSDYDMYGWYASYANVGELLQKYFASSEPYSPYVAAKEQGAKLTEIVTKAGAEVDPKKRGALYDEAQMMIAQDNLWLPMTHEALVIVYNKKKVSGVRPSGLYAGGFYKGIDLDVPK